MFGFPQVPTYVQGYSRNINNQEIPIIVSRSMSLLVITLGYFTDACQFEIQI